LFDCGTKIGQANRQAQSLAQITAASNNIFDKKAFLEAARRGSAVFW
jgi:hypothetical protein